MLSINIILQKKVSLSLIMYKNKKLKLRKDRSKKFNKLEVNFFELIYNLNVNKNK